MHKWCLKNRFSVFFRFFLDGFRFRFFPRTAPAYFQDGNWSQLFSRKTATSPNKDVFPSYPSECSWPYFWKVKVQLPIPLWPSHCVFSLKVSSSESDGGFQNPSDLIVRWIFSKRSSLVVASSVFVVDDSVNSLSSCNTSASFKNLIVNNFKMLYRSNSVTSNKLLLLEALYIKFNKPELNCDRKASKDLSLFL